MLWFEDRRLWAPADGAGGEGGDGGGADTAKEPGSQGSESPGSTGTPEWAVKLIENQGMTTAVLQKIAEMAIESRNASQPSQTTEDDEDPDEEVGDLELLDRKTFAAHIVRMVEKAVNNNVVVPLTQQIEALKQTTTRAELTGAVQELRKAHKDFGDWVPEMTQIAKEHPGLPPHRLYKLARAEYPDKAKTLDAKYNPPSGIERMKIRNFGGLTPTQSGTGSRSRNMNPREAADAAWEATVSALNGEPIFGEE